ncbi:MAG: hypothetical protein WCB12_09310 [Bryobacteraceae bacterium]
MDRSQSVAMKAASTLVLSAVAAGATALLAQTGQAVDPRDLLSAVAETYRNLNSFEWTAFSTTSSDSGEIQPNTVLVLGAFRRPHSMRVELRRKTPPSDTVWTTNGSGVLEYHKERNGFCRPDPKPYLRDASPGAMPSVASSLPYEHILEGLKSARFVGYQFLKVNGEVVSCVVVSVPYSLAKSDWTEAVQTAAIIYWIETKSKIVVQQSTNFTLKLRGRTRPRTDASTITLVSYRLNPELPDARFTLRPPAGAKEWPCIVFSSGW